MGGLNSSWGLKGENQGTAEDRLVNKETGIWQTEGIELFILNTRRFQSREPLGVGRRMDCFSPLQTPSSMGSSEGVSEAPACRPC